MGRNRLSVPDAFARDAGRYTIADNGVRRGECSPPCLQPPDFDCSTGTGKPFTGMCAGDDMRPPTNPGPSKVYGKESVEQRNLVVSRPSVLVRKPCTI